MDPTSAQLAALVAGPALMVLATLCERRWGAQAAGLVAAAPVTVLVGAVLVSADLGPDAGRELALSTSARVPAQVVLAIVFFHAASHHGRLLALTVATVPYAGLTWLTLQGPPSGAVALGVVAAIVGRRLLGPAEDDRGPVGVGLPSTAQVITLRAGITLVATTALVVTAHLFGPALGGAVGAFPMLSVTLALLVATARGTTGMRNVMRGLVRALPAYLSFGVAYWLTTPRLGEAGGIVTAVFACLLVYGAVNRDGRQSPDKDCKELFANGCLQS